MSQRNSRNPLVLIHGIDDTASLFDPITPFLQQQGWDVYSLDLIPNNGDAGLDHLAMQVANFVNTTFEPHQAIDLIGFSMGGIISRYYVQRLNGIDRVQRFITISSPHQGTWVGHLRFNQGAEQMRPGSSFLNQLNADVQMLERIKFTSIWTPLDLMIVPANSSHLPVGREVVIPVGNHAWMMLDRSVWEAIAIALREPILASSRVDANSLQPMQSR